MMPLFAATDGVGIAAIAAADASVDVCDTTVDMLSDLNTDATPSSTPPDTLANQDNTVMSQRLNQHANAEAFVHQTACMVMVDFLTGVFWRLYLQTVQPTKCV